MKLFRGLVEINFYFSITSFMFTRKMIRPFISFPNLLNQFYLIQSIFPNLYLRKLESEYMGKEAKANKIKFDFYQKKS